MTLIDKMELQLNPSIEKEELLKRGALDNNESAWYLADIYGLHQKYKGMGYLMMKYFNEHLFKEKDYAFTNSDLNPFFDWTNVGELKIKGDKTKYYNYRKMS